MYQLRFYFNPKNYEVVGTYATASLAYGMRKKKGSLSQYPINKLRVVKVD